MHIDLLLTLSGCVAEVSQQSAETLMERDGGGWGRKRRGNLTIRRRYWGEIPPPQSLHRINIWNEKTTFAESRVPPKTPHINHRHYGKVKYYFNLKIKPSWRRMRRSEEMSNYEVRSCFATFIVMLLTTGWLTFVAIFSEVHYGDTVWFAFMQRPCDESMVSFRCADSKKDWEALTP